MFLHVVTHDSSTVSIDALEQAFSELGHRTDCSVLPADTLTDAADFGHRLHRTWSGDRPDAVLALGWLPGLSAQVGTRGLATPVLQRLYAPGRSADPQRRRLEGAIGRGASRVLALCSSDVERLVQIGVRRSSVRIVPHGVDTATFSDQGPGLPVGDTPRLVARPVDRAAAARLLDLLPALPRCELVLLTTSGTVAGVSNALTVALERHPVVGRVRLVDLESGGGPTALAALLRSTDLALAVDDDEPTLDLALHAMACGVPVVAAAAGAITDIVADGVTGLLVATTPAEALADSVRALLGDQLARETYGLAAGDRARASFGWPTVAAAMVRVAAEVTGDANPNPATAPQPVPAP